MTIKLSKATQDGDIDALCNMDCADEIRKTGFRRMLLAALTASCAANA